MEKTLQERLRYWARLNGAPIWTEAADAIDARETLIENLLVASESAHAAITALKDDLRKSAERIKALEEGLAHLIAFIDAFGHESYGEAEDKARALLQPRG